MPLQRCSENNKSGWKWGDQGKCYTGPGAKKKAIKQGLAENGGKLDAFMNELSDDEYDEIMGDREIPWMTRIKMSLARKA